MTSPRFTPRDYSTDKRAFGKTKEIEWKTVDNVDDQGMASAARFQHYFVYRIRQRLFERNIGMAEYATTTGQTYDRFIKALRGEIVMKLEEIFLAELLLGKIIDPEGDPLHKFAAEMSATTRDSGG